MKNPKKTGIVIFIIILIICCAYAALTILFSGRTKDVRKGGSDHETKSPFTFVFNNGGSNRTRPSAIGGKYVASLYIEGEITDTGDTYNQEWLLQTIDDLKNDKRNLAILLYINSPGGGVYQADDVYLALQDYKTAGKKVYAYMGPLAASGGYYISCAADKIYANRNTLTGSIGVIAGESVDLTGLMEKYGIKSETITAGKNKNMFNYNCPLTDEQRRIMQGVADECYDQFTGIVASCRRLSKKQVISLADGRIYTAQQALKYGLIDGIGSWDHTADILCSDELNEPNCRIEEFRYSRQPSFLEMLTGAVTSIKGTTASTAQIIPESLLKKITPNVSYPAYIYKGNR